MTAARPVPICLLGPGAVGRALLAQIAAPPAGRAGRWARQLPVAAIADRSAIVSGTRGGIDPATLAALGSHKAAGRALAAWVPAPGADGARRVDGLDPAQVEALGGPPILVDCTAADTTASLADARARGWRLVLANKVPLTGARASYEHLTQGGAGARWEATVASSLPVVGTLQALVDQGDQVRWITGTLSGTLGVVTERLAAGHRLSDTVRTCVAEGLCEPDPRADLSGEDVARKALILARMAGLDLELAAVAREALYPGSWDDLDPGAWLERLPEADAGLAARFAEAARLGSVLRYQVTVGGGRVRAGWTALAPDAPLGRAAATTSMVVIETDRFSAQPLVLAGRAGGPGAAAAAVLGDIVALARS